MSASELASVHRLLQQAVAELAAACGPAASDEQLLSILTVCEGVTRQLERLSVTTIADLERRGSFAQRGYRSTVGALSDLLGWERFDSRRRLTVAEQVCPRIGVDGTILPARLTATAEVFTAGGCSLRHAEAIARIMNCDSAGRLAPQVWAAAEAQIAAKAGEYSPSDLQRWGMELVEKLDQDGPEPDDRPPAQVNELLLTRNPDGKGGKLKARFDDAALFDAIATVIDAKAAPRTADDDRSHAQRQAEALADVCGFVLERGDNVPETGGRRPHLTVLVRLEDLENRASAACLDFGGTLTPQSLRMLACDATVIPVVMGGAGQPLDVGRAMRTVPDGLRRAVAARDRGCAKCGAPPAWCDVHHIVPWELLGDTKLENCCMLCKTCHRLVHHGGWDVRLRNHQPEFLPPPWIDHHRTPQRRPQLLLIPAS